MFGGLLKDNINLSGLADSSARSHWTIELIILFPI
jgi:hypothetical protein